MRAPFASSQRGDANAADSRLLDLDTQARAELHQAAQFLQYIRNMAKRCGSSRSPASCAAAPPKRSRRSGSRPGNIPPMRS